MKIFLPIHIDGGNRGCEAITKGTALLLGLPAEQIQALSRNVALDKRLGLVACTTLLPFPAVTFCWRVRRKLLQLLCGNGKKTQDFTYKRLYAPFLDRMVTGDVMLSTGGDMMCYGNNEVIYTNDYLHDKGIRTILWGCSIGKENLTREKLETLGHFSLIYARESLTAEMLEGLGLKNVVLCPDPAFILEPETCSLPNAFRKDVVGLNLSNYVLGKDGLDTPFGGETVKLVKYILTQTELNILLIPHVMWKGQDDRLAATAVQEHFKGEPRITVLDSDRLNYGQLRYVISRCRYFVGARTHAVISAYSTCVPALALGYSVKSKGIAKDLGLSERLVVDSKHCAPGMLVDSFKYLMETEDDVRSHLQEVMSDYVKRLEKVKSFVG